MSTTAKILCVDDEPSILGTLERLLRRKFEPFTATSMSEGLEILKAHPDVAVVLSDYRMPGGNGVEFLRAVRALYPQMSRAILSGQMDLNQVANAINEGDIHKFFLKPWENDYLELQMLEAVQLHRALQERAHFEHLSITDPVTQLTNHRHFQNQLRRRLEVNKLNGHGLALVLFDVDHFKAFNDRYGHPEGDRLLFAVAEQLKKLAPKGADVSRYGGEEFTVLFDLSDTKESQIKEAEKIAEGIRAYFQKTPFPGLSAGPAYVTMSGGIACSPHHSTQASQLVELADRALYQAKRQGRNQVVSSPRIET